LLWEPRHTLQHMRGTSVLYLLQHSSFQSIAVSMLVLALLSAYPLNLF
jgi:hypothetical protein